MIKIVGVNRDISVSGPGPVNVLRPRDHNKHYMSKQKLKLSYKTQTQMIDANKLSINKINFMYVQVKGTGSR